MRLRKLGAKKGALDVSINAIVVIIFAITMLGLGLAFMKGMFGKIGGEVSGVISSAKLENPPTASDPFTISPVQIDLKKGETTTINIGYYNSGTGAETVTLAANCGTTAAISKKPESFSGRQVAAGDTLAWQIAISAAKTTTPDTYPCDVSATGGASPKYGNFFVTVK